MTHNSISMRQATHEDWHQIWPIFHQVVKAGDTYSYDPDTSFEQGRTLWMDAPRQTWVFEQDAHILGTYYIKTNQPGNGAHVCNCGYMVSADARGKGLATAMCEHSKHIALGLGYRAMQFNFVVSSNHGAVQLWQKLGFDIVGRLPRAFNHPKQGLVDALVMYQWLDDQIMGRY